jgi:hypothetical protein
MEDHNFYTLAVELEPNARLSDARSAQTVIEGLKKTRKNFKVRNTERLEEKVQLVSPEDYEEIEETHYLPPGTLKIVFEKLETDLKDYPDSSPVANVRRVNEKWVLQDIIELAEQLASKDARVKGIGSSRSLALIKSSQTLLEIAHLYAGGYE